MRLRYRVDGVLMTQPRRPANATGADLALQNHEQLDIAERRLPQDGRMRVRVSGKDYDCAFRNANRSRRKNRAARPR